MFIYQVGQVNVFEIYILTCKITALLLRQCLAPNKESGAAFTLVRNIPEESKCGKPVISKSTLKEEQISPNLVSVVSQIVFTIP